MKEHAMSSEPCKYCDKGDLLVGMHVFRSLPSSDVLLVADARFPGRCVVAARWHVRELFELTQAQRDAFMADVNAVASAVAQATGAAKINIGLYGDLSDHLHAHVVPKQHGGSQWGDTFALQPQAPVATEATSLAEVERRIDAAL
jgi:diadenosine tetraphosphate (Ap4A) HIT family hydrolase